ncbi:MULTISPECIES: YrhB domain-containing protein [Microbacterium]|uniref:YrhB domain-containing protein n=1 Tax=Microbacterium TaxID=33882 RepID=UPI0027851FEE|nr:MULTISPECIES: YrhB domain-containing protein [Microbacterium]MDQ1085403.1 hypothetical protein [Microbacterium sp. SORGH_AS_0344]MDQ1169291.1 hypothetical protein [Microbacterium proteolyticum]
MGDVVTGLSKEQATAIALCCLAASTKGDGIERVPLGEPVDGGFAWVFFFQGRGYVERGDLDEMLVGNMPVVVPVDGRAPYALDARRDVDAQIERLREAQG